MNPGEKWPPEEGAEESAEPAEGAEGAEGAADAEPRILPPEFIDLVVGSSLVPAICSYLRNDSGNSIHANFPFKSLPPALIVSRLIRVGSSRRNIKLCSNCNECDTVEDAYHVLMECVRNEVLTS